MFLFEGDEPVKDVLDDSDLLDQITDLLNEDSPSPHWRHLAKELKIPQEKCKIFEPSQDDNSPTKLLFRSIENCEPDLTFEELVLALVAMKRQDALDVLPKYFSGRFQLSSLHSNCYGVGLIFDVLFQHIKYMEFFPWHNVKLLKTYY